MKKRILFVFIAVLTVIGLSLILTNTKQRHRPQQTTTIGGLYPLTGPVASLGEQFRNGALLAVQDINKKEQAQLLSLTIEDSQMDPKVALAGAQKLSSINRANIIHTLGSGVSLAIKPITEQNNVLLFSDASHPEITKGSSLVLRHSNVAEDDARVLVGFLKESKQKIIALIYINDEWGKAFFSQYQQDVSDQLPESTLVSESHDPKEKDFRTILYKLITQQPDSFIVASFGPTPGIILNQLKELGYTGRIIFNVGLALSTEAQQIAQDNLQGVYYQTFGKLPQAFIDHYTTAYQKPPSIFGLYAYTDFELLHDAIKRVGQDPNNIARYIKGLSSFQGSYETVDINLRGDITIPTHIEQWE